MNNKTSTTLLTGENLQFIEQLYGEYLENPDAVDPSWIPLFNEYFQRADAPILNGSSPKFRARGLFEPARVGGGVAGSPSENAVYEDRIEGTRVRAPERTSRFAAEVESMVRAYRLHGHLISHIDPLRDSPSDAPPEARPLELRLWPR